MGAINNASCILDLFLSHSHFGVIDEFESIEEICVIIVEQHSNNSEPVVAGFMGAHLK